MDTVEAPGVEPVFPEKGDALRYAIERMRSRTGETHVFDAAGNMEKVIPFTRDRTPDLSGDASSRIQRARMMGRYPTAPFIPIQAGRLTGRMPLISTPERHLP